MKIFITRKIPEAGIKMIRNSGYEVEISDYDGVLPREKLLEKAKGADAILCLLTDKIDEEVLAAAGAQLKIVANYAVGYDNFDLEAAKRRGVFMTNTPDVLTETVAEHAIALMFSASRRIIESDRFMREGRYKGWEPMLFLGNDMLGKTLGLVGFGRIGAAVAKRMHNGFEMKILYFDIKRNESMERKRGFEYRDLESLLRESDFISIHVPLLPATKHLIGEAQFKIMKPSAYLINTSRGPVIDEKALVLALKRGIIRGAGLDVYEEEPEMAAGLVNLTNVVLTPHIASATEETRSKMSELAALNIIAALEGKTPPNVIK